MNGAAANVVSASFVEALSDARPLRKKAEESMRKGCGYQFLCINICVLV